jgi:AcrR family transcriptional regulator
MSQRDALTPERVVEAALRLADEHGLEALTMRRLGTALGVEAMSLYRHVASKEALLDALADAIVRAWTESGSPDSSGSPGGTDAPDSTGWRTGIAVIMHRAHAVLLARPWAIELLAARPHVGPARLRYAEAITSRLLAAGFSPALAHHGMHIVDGTIMGFSAQQARRPTAAAMGSEVQRLWDGELAATHPAISLTIRERHDHGEEYALMVDLVLDGLSRLRDGDRPPVSMPGAAYAQLIG